MQQFLDREKEMKTLEDEYSTKESSFVVIYGRRRVGKTTLIDRFLDEHENTIYFMATAERNEQNLRSFRDAVSEAIGNNLLSRSEAGWEETFRYITEYEPERKKIIAIDEFQYIAMKDPSFPSVLQRIWDTVLKENSIMLIICGSLINMMRSQTLDRSSPLYGRRTSQIRMGQIPFVSYSEFCPELNEKALIEHYAVTGGVPKYIESFIGYDDIFEGIEHNILNENSYLFNEVSFLLEKEVSDAGSYFTLLKAIAAGNHKMSEIASFIGMRQSDLTLILRTLRELDILERRVPVTEKNPEKSKKGLYFIKDNYISFWFRYVYPNMSMLERGKKDHVLDIIRRSFSQNHMPGIYEDVCREIVWNIPKNVLGFSVSDVGSYWGKEASETEIVTLSSDRKHVLLGECKYSQSPVDVDVLEHLVGKKDDFRNITNAEKFRFAVFSLSGFTDDAIDMAKGSRILLFECTEPVRY